MKAKSENLLKGKKDNSFRKGWPAEQRAVRRTQAQKRQEIHDSLTTEQKIEKVIARIGPEKGCKELDKLRLRLLKEQEAAAKPKKESKKGESHT